MLFFLVLFFSVYPAETSFIETRHRGEARNMNLH